VSAIRRGVKNTFRNPTRAVSVVLILSIAFALSISMLVARQSASAKINSVLANVGTTISVSPAGFSGFTGSGTPLPNSDITTILKVPDVTKVGASLTATLTSTTTSLTNPNPTGSLGQGGGGFSNPNPGSNSTRTNRFTPGIRVIGSNDPGTALVGVGGGGTPTLSSGTTYAANSTADVAVVGTTLATTNSLKVGSTFTAWSKTFTVIGIYNAQSTFTDSDLLIPLATVQKLTGQTGDVSSLVVTVNTLANVSTVQSQIEKDLSTAADVTSTQSAAESEVSPILSVRSISTISLIAAVVAAIVILLLSMLMVVRERRREIGVLKALGASNRSVVGQFMAESTTFTAISALVGLGLGILLASPITSALSSNNSSTPTGPGGFARGNFGGNPGSFPTGGSGFPRHLSSLNSAFTTLHASASWTTIVIAAVFAIVIAVVGSSLAAYNVVRVRPAEVLRSE
jgi:putative ABC transport system permease protein